MLKWEQIGHTQQENSIWKISKEKIENIKHRLTRATKWTGAGIKVMFFTCSKTSGLHQVSLLLLVARCVVAYIVISPCQISQKRSLGLKEWENVEESCIEYKTQTSVLQFSLGEADSVGISLSPLKQCWLNAEMWVALHLRNNSSVIS